MERAWQEDTYEAWVERFGTPAEASQRIRKDPAARLYPIYKYFETVSGKKIANLMGSNGVKAVALAILGAKVTVIDFSEGNARYAGELSAAAGTDRLCENSQPINIKSLIWYNKVELRR